MRCTSNSQLEEELGDAGAFNTFYKPKTEDNEEATVGYKDAQLFSLTREIVNNFTNGTYAIHVLAAIGLCVAGCYAFKLSKKNHPTYAVI